MSKKKGLEKILFLITIISVSLGTICLFPACYVGFWLDDPMGGMKYIIWCFGGLVIGYIAISIAKSRGFTK